RIAYRFAHTLIHDGNAFYPFCVRRLDRFVKDLIFSRNFFRREMNKEIAHKIERSDLDRVYPKAGSPGSGTKLRWYFYHLNVLHEGKSLIRTSFISITATNRTTYQTGI